MSIEQLQREVLAKVLTADGALCAQDLGRLECVAKLFTRELIDDAAEVIVSTMDHPERCPRRDVVVEPYSANGTPGARHAGERWLAIMRQLEQYDKELCFSSTLGKRLPAAISMLPTAVASLLPAPTLTHYWAPHGTHHNMGSEVCSESPMRAGTGWDISRELHDPPEHNLGFYRRRTLRAVQ